MTENARTKVAIGISGGVDSSVAAALLMEQGYEVVGVHMKCFQEDVPYCTATEDREYAVRVASRLGIPLKFYDFRQEYKQKVIDYMVGEYEKNRTPNPDVVCNRDIKFGVLYDKVFPDLQVDYLATGHYARIGIVNKTKHEALNTKFETNPNFQVITYQNVLDFGFRDSNFRIDDIRLMKGVDSSKDQSYFLALLSKEQLAKALFPLGELTKKEVRELAQKYALPTADKPDSQGICFVGEVGMREFLKDRIRLIPGEVVRVLPEQRTKNQEQIEVIGVHQGLPLYTIGQRHGFRLNNPSEQPLYVVGKDIVHNRLIVGEKALLSCDRLCVEIRWLFPEYRTENLDLSVRIRHLGRLHKCKLNSGADKEMNSKSDEQISRVEVILNEPVEAVAPGQMAVFYDGDLVLGAGEIASGLPG